MLALLAPLGVLLLGRTGTPVRLLGRSPLLRAESRRQARRAHAPVRLFKNAMLERFTRTSPTITIGFWLPISCGAIILGASEGQATSASVVGALAVGLAAWMPVEYFLHRFVFHLDRWIPTASRFCFVMHGCHHADPDDGSRDMMPLVGSTPMMSVVLVGSVLSLGHALGLVFFGAFALAYLAYDVMHHGVHQWSLRGRIGSYLQRHHLLHHFRDDTRHFGVTSPLCDWLFGTLRMVRPNE